MATPISTWTCLLILIMILHRTYGYFTISRCFEPAENLELCAIGSHEAVIHPNYRDKVNTALYSLEDQGTFCVWLKILGTEIYDQMIFNNTRYNVLNAIVLVYIPFKKELRVNIGTNRGAIFKLEIPPKIWTHLCIIWTENGNVTLYSNEKEIGRRPLEDKRLIMAYQGNLYAFGTNVKTCMTQAKFWNFPKNESAVLSIGCGEYVPNSLIVWDEIPWCAVDRPDSIEVRTSSLEISAIYNCTRNIEKKPKMSGCFEATPNQEVCALRSGNRVRIHPDYWDGVNTALSSLELQGTFCVWLRVMGSEIYDSVVFNDTKREGSNAISLVYIPNRKHITVFIGTNRRANFSLLLPPETWTHICVTWTESGETTLYSNGEKIGKQTLRKGGGCYPTNQMYVKGRNRQGLTETCMTEVKFWNYTMDGDEVLSIGCGESVPNSLIVWDDIPWCAVDRPDSIEVRPSSLEKSAIYNCPINTDEYDEGQDERKDEGQIKDEC